MKKILLNEDQQSLEVTITDQLDLICKVFNIEDAYNGDYKRMLVVAKEKLSDKHYEVFYDLYKARMKLVIKSIYIFRQVYKANDYDDKFDIFRKYIKSSKQITSLLEILDTTLKNKKDNLHLHKDIDKDERVRKLHQDWCISYILSNIED